MSRDTIRGYRKFERALAKHNEKNKVKQIASSGLLARRSAPAKKTTSDDQMSFLFNMVEEIRKYGGNTNG